MAANATDVLSLANARGQLRADEGAEIDALITSAIKSAVDYVSRMTGIPLVDRDVIFNVSESGKTPLVLPVRDVKEVVCFDYWDFAGELRAEPNRQITVSDLGRIEELENGCTRIWYPDSGWPSKLDDSEFRVTVKIGFDIDDASESLREAVILLARVFFENPDRFESEFAVMALIKPWMRYGS